MAKAAKTRRVAEKYLRGVLQGLIQQAVRRENRSCYLIAVHQTWLANEMRDRSRARITHQVAKDIAEAIERRHG